MKLTFVGNELQIDEAKIIHKNFEGRSSKYNREGDRNFSVVIPNRESADELIERGWNVKIREPKEEGDDPFFYLPVKVKFNNWGPKVYLVTGNRHNRLEEDVVKMLDKDIVIQSANMDLRPSHWEVNGKTGVTAYLKSIEIIQEIDRFAARYAEEENPEE